MSPSVVARAPGRVNLIGEHTDYNDGFVLPMALPFETTIAARARGDRTVRLESAGYGETRFSLDAPPDEADGWARYVAGMAHMLDSTGVPVSGFDASISTTIPVGASLSSSAALELASGFAMCGLVGVEPDPVLLARLGQRVENEIIGIQSGIMDQLISAVATPEGPTLIDCRSLETTPFALPADGLVVIMDTMTRRELAESEYDRRRASCERVAAALGHRVLRDATPAEVEALPPGTDRRRARHVVSENARVLAAVEALVRSDGVAFGALMNESHESLRTDYEVSSPALDLIVEIAREHEACLGARMTGGGFGGCAVALIDRPAGATFVEHVRERYGEAHGSHPDVWPVDPGAGASVRSDASTRR